MPSADSTQDAVQVAVSRLYCDEGDVTHFADDAIPWHSANGTGNAATPLLPASDVGFLRIAAGYRSGWHPAPRKQYVMVLEGCMAVEAGDGEVRRFEPGSVLLVTDVAGRGHRTSAQGNAEVLLVWVPVP